MHVIDQPGRGPNTVCLHGFCQSSLFWEPTLARLTAVGFGGLAPDLPGFGASAAELGPYTMEAYADAIARLLDRRGLDQVAIVGGSMGGVVAQHFALRHPARLTRLLLVATGAFTRDPAAALAKADQLAISEWAEALTGPMVDGFFHRAPSAAERRAFLQAAGMANREAAVEAARSNALSRTFERLHEITVPTLIVQGRHDRTRTPEHGAEMASQIGGAQLFVLEGSGHTPQIEEPEAFWEVALPFLAGKT
jgi:3-oxoadipate enol-lactonase